ncbi:MAG: polysaccharide lyase 8 family protein [Williamsia sp.]|nr:polysaccharide lyase 8 family protein [Williamsia sp.]
MSKMLLFLLLLFPGSFLRAPFKRVPLPDEKLESLKQQVTKDILALSFNPADVTAIAEKMKTDGSWADIDYADKTRGGWPVNQHLERLNSMAVLYKRPGSPWTGNAKLEDQIMRGLDFWLEHDPICPNWWYPEIGVPKVLGPTMILMEDKLSPSQKEAGIKILNRAKIGMTGQNKVWLSGNVIYRSLINGDTAQIRAAVKAIQEEVVVSEAEGIQPDFSFHQHGTQQQFGNYGSAYAADMLKWAAIFQPTSYRFEKEKVEILRNYLLKGMRWIIWKHKMDISACGRQLFPDAQTDKATSIRRIMEKMPLVDPAAQKQYATALDDFEGDTHFWKSDMTVHRRKDFYASVKMSSKRVGGAESCNEENIQGYHLGDGATYFYQSNDEYTDIFPFWDWKMIPGTTAFHDAQPLPVLSCSGYNLPVDFAGGVSDGTNGIAALAYSRDSLYAQKAWFFFDDAVICLGADIHSALDKEVRTTVNQSYLHGPVQVKQATGTHALEAGQHPLSAVSWVLHDKWGYFFPGGASVEVSNRAQSGDWNRVLKRMPPKTMQADLFTLWFNHHIKPAAESYAYYVFPGATAENIDQRAVRIRVTQNSGKIQAVENREKQLAGFVFAAAGEATSAVCKKISADKPCVLMVAGRKSGFTITLADPTHKQQEIVVGIAGKRKTGNGAVTYDAEKDMSMIKVALPKEWEAGKSLQIVVE